MSYDLHINEEDFNYTYNVSKMWYACFPEKGIREHYGLTGEQAVPVLRQLRDYMEDNYEVLTKWNPENGWGSYDGALEFVNKLILASIRNPKGIWRGD